MSLYNKIKEDCPVAREDFIPVVGPVKHLVRANENKQEPNNVVIAGLALYNASLIMVPYVAAMMYINRGS